MQCYVCRSVKPVSALSNILVQCSGALKNNLELSQVNKPIKYTYNNLQVKLTLANHSPAVHC